MLFQVAWIARPSGSKSTCHQRKGGAARSREQTIWIPSEFDDRRGISLAQGAGTQSGTGFSTSGICTNPGRVRLTGSLRRPPPSTLMDVPRTWSAALEHRKTATAPICSGRAKSSDGRFSASNLAFASLLEIPSRAAASSICFCTIGVNTQPGQIALHVIGERAVSSATTFVRPRSPC